jgi:hypothetical protein
VAYSRDQAIRLLAHDLGDPLTPGILSTEGVRYVIVHDDFYLDNGRTAPQLDPAHFDLLKRFGSIRIFSVHAPKMNIAAVLRAHQSYVAVLQGLVPPTVTYGDGFNAPEQYNGSTSHWMIQDGKLEIANAAASMEVVLTGSAFSNQRPRLLELEDDTGRVLARQTVYPFEGALHLGPLQIRHGRSSLTLVAVPGPAPLGSSDSREASVFLSAIVLRPLPAYVGNSNR